VAPTKTIVISLLLLFSRFAAADDDPLSKLSGRVGDIANGGPVEGAQVFVRAAESQERLAITDRTGRYTLEVKPGTYEVAFVFGQSRTTGRVSVEAGRPATLDGKVDSASGEVIVIRDRRPPKVLPKPTNYTPSKLLPYSQEALDKDAWTRAWLMLDVSPTGEVTRFKFLKRPGYNLERITTDEVFKLRFEPARDDEDRAVRTWIVWSFEWPANGWLVTFNHPRTRMPPLVGFPPRRMTDYVPCKGSGPMLLGSLYPTYRDCSTPDLTRMPHEPWVVRP
jgi:hypothetical protein